MIMRGSGRLQRFVRLPFSIRCDSESSVALAAVSSNSNTRENGEKEKSKMKENQRHSKGLFTQGLQRLIKGYKTFSQIFLYKEEMEEMETEMEIGFPTDVKHVTHIGLDGSTAINTLKAADQLLSFPSISLQQFELAMAAQSHAPISA